MALRIDDVDLQRDRALVQRFQEGDATAFDVLYRRYFARLQRFCLKRVGDPYEAEEIAQEAFTRALRALPSFGGERRFYPWMTVIASRLCVDHHRRRGRSEPAEVIDLGVVEGGQEAIVDRCDFAVLGTALDRLAPRHREVLDMRERRGWTYQQIATHYEVPVGTIEALLFRARKALKREFLAVTSGDKLGAFGALPVLGGLVRRWGTFKAKAAAWASALPPAVAPVLGVAVAVGSVAAVGVATLPSPDAIASRPAGVVRVIDVPVAPVSAELVPEVLVTSSMAAAPAGRVDSPEARAAEPYADLPTNTRVGSAGATAAEAEQKPVTESVDVAGEEIVIGVDPDTVVAEAKNTITGW